MRKKKLLIGALALGLLLIFLWPLSFPVLTENRDSISIVKTDLLFPVGDDGRTHSDMQAATYSFAADSPEAAAIQDILGRYSYRRTLRTLFSDASIEGNEAGYWLHIYGDYNITAGGTGEVIVGNHVYRMGLWGGKASLALMEEISAVLASAEPLEIS